LAGVTRPIVALDVPTFDAAVSMVDMLGDECDFYKVGLQLYAADGPDTVEWLRAEGKSVFVDLKAHDIPNTVRGVAQSVAALGASLFTVHGAGGEAMVRAAVEGAGAQNGSGCGVLVVTVLTSFDAAGYAAAVGKATIDVPAEVDRLADVAAAAGAHGVVCSGHEAGRVRDRFQGTLRTLVPGVRPAGAATAGAGYVILGRAVTAAADPREAFLTIRAELSAASNGR
jgi:orotidine-5'-phosphate decarboxylase